MIDAERQRHVRIVGDQHDHGGAEAIRDNRHDDRGKTEGNALPEGAIGQIGIQDAQRNG